MKNRIIFGASAKQTATSLGGSSHKVVNAAKFMRSSLPTTFTHNFLISLLSAAVFSAQADVLLGPFQPGTGSWTTVPQGDFEFGPQAIPAIASYSGSGTMVLILSAGSSGNASTDPLAAQGGSLGGIIRPNAFVGPGIALAYNGVVQVNAGVSYVLSAFVRRPTPEASQANVYLDLWDVPGDLKVETSANTSGWQFVWGTYTPVSNTQISARVVVDFNVGLNDVVYVDSLALTPASHFQPPSIAVPKPSVLRPRWASIKAFFRCR